MKQNQCEKITRFLFENEKNNRRSSKQNKSNNYSNYNYKNKLKQRKNANPHPAQWAFGRADSGAESTTIFSSVKGWWHFAVRLVGPPEPSLWSGGWSGFGTSKARWQKGSKICTFLASFFGQNNANNFSCRHWQFTPCGTAKFEKKGNFVLTVFRKTTQMYHCALPSAGKDTLRVWFRIREGLGFFDDSYERLLVPRWPPGHSVCGRDCGTTYFL